MKKVSVVIPCYNTEKYIDRCVDSLVRQTLGVKEMELIFIDDASEDHTLEKLMEWEKKYPEQIMVIPCETNGKQGTARNIGMQYATGEYIGFVDSDDYVSVDMYQVLYEKAKEEDCDVVGGLYVREYEDGTIAMKPEQPSGAGKKVCINGVEARKHLMQHGGLPGGVWSKIYRRELLLEHQLMFPENILYEDNYWTAFLVQYLHSYYVVNQYLYHYIVNEQSTIMKKDSMHHLDRLVIELMKVEEYKKQGVFDIYHDEIEISFLKLYFINTIRIMFVRFQVIPYEIIYTMQGNVKELFPDYQKNPYIQELPQLQREILKMVDVPLDEKKIDILADAYHDVLRQNHYIL